MIATLIFILAVVVFLAFFVGYNLSNVCSIWFFKLYTNVQVSVLIFIAFAAGIIFSILIYFISQLKKGSSDSSDGEKENRRILEKRRAEEKRRVEETRRSEEKSLNHIEEKRRVEEKNNIDEKKPASEKRRFFGKFRSAEKKDAVELQNQTGNQSENKKIGDKKSDDKNSLN